jgi:hypothetical protein
MNAVESAVLDIIRNHSTPECRIRPLYHDELPTLDVPHAKDDFNQPGCKVFGDGGLTFVPTKDREDRKVRLVPGPGTNFIGYFCPETKSACLITKRASILS